MIRLTYTHSAHSDSFRYIDAEISLPMSGVTFSFSRLFVDWADFFTALAERMEMKQVPIAGINCLAIAAEYTPISTINILGGEVANPSESNNWNGVAISQEQLKGADVATPWGDAIITDVSLVEGYWIYTFDGKGGFRAKK